MMQQNRNNSTGSYAEFSAQYGNLYATGYAIGESEAKSALSRLAACLPRLLGRTATSKPRREPVAAPIGRKATAKS